MVKVARIDLEVPGRVAIPVWGYIPSYLDEADPRSAVEQFDANYIGGFRNFKGFEFDKNRSTLKYKGDLPMMPIAMMRFRDSRIFLYRSAWVLVLEADGKWQVARMD